MRKLNKIVVCVFFTLTTLSCSINPLKNVSSDGLIFNGSYVYFNGKPCAKLESIEIALDDKKLVTEATFVLTSSKYNEHALKIIKAVTEKKPEWEVEVELRIEQFNN